tara:strand:- start:2 stop:244 length:243 start_codon:yes stop_codon:yes gene_type:complete
MTFRHKCNGILNTRLKIISKLAGMVIINTPRVWKKLQGHRVWNISFWWLTFHIDEPLLGIELYDFGFSMLSAKTSSSDFV